MSTEEAAGLASGPDQLLQPSLSAQLECAKEGEPRHHIWLVTPSGLPQSSLPSSSSSSRQGYERKPDLSLLRTQSALNVPDRAARESLHDTTAQGRVPI